MAANGPLNDPAGLTGLKTAEEVYDRAKEEGKALPLLSLSDYKQAMRQFFTVRRDTVVACGHKLDVAMQPKNNCQFCWFAFFQTHGEMVQTADEVFTSHGPDQLTRIRGAKFTKNFVRFMATVAKMKEIAETDGRIHDSASAADSAPADDGAADRSTEHAELPGVEVTQ